MSLQLIIYILLILGILAMGGTFTRRKRLLQESLSEDKEAVRGLLYQPLQELFLGIIFTAAGFFFASRIFAGHKSLLLAFAIAAAVAAMSSLGAYSRFQNAEKMRSLEPQVARRLTNLQIVNCLGIFMLLISLLIIIATNLGLGQN